MILSEELQKRGYIYQFSAEKLAEVLDNKKRTFYLGIDPTADSLHVGHLLTLFMAKRLSDNGHKAVILVGGATGMIGDPSGKNKERNLLDEKIIKGNVEKVKKQIKSIFKYFDFRVVNNNDWLSKINIVSFLRDIGKYFSINVLMQRESIKKRMDNPESGISYTEFSYALLQAYDFFYLNDKFNCDLQIGGSDQWGNIISGIDLIRRLREKEVYGLTCPLLINESTGEKFGKTEGGAVWLDPKKTSAYDFYQFWLNVGDNVAIKYLKLFSFLNLEEIELVEKEFNQDPTKRLAQKTLALEITKIVHGEKEAVAAEKISTILFGDREIKDFDLYTKKLLLTKMPHKKIKLGVGKKIVEILTECDLVKSKSEGFRLVSEGGILLNNKKITDPNYLVTGTDSLQGFILIKKGKKVFFGLEV